MTIWTLLMHIWTGSVTAVRAIVEAVIESGQELRRSLQGWALGLTGVGVLFWFYAWATRDTDAILFAAVFAAGAAVVLAVCRFLLQSVAWTVAKAIPTIITRTTLPREQNDVFALVVDYFNGLRENANTELASIFQTVKEDCTKTMQRAKLLISEVILIGLFLSVIPPWEMGKHMLPILLIVCMMFPVLYGMLERQGRENRLIYGAVGMYFLYLLFSVKVPATAELSQAMGQAVNSFVATTADCIRVEGSDCLSPEEDQAPQVKGPWQRYLPAYTGKPDEARLYMDTPCVRQGTEPYVVVQAEREVFWQGTTPGELHSILDLIPGEENPLKTLQTVGIRVYGKTLPTNWKFRMYAPVSSKPTGVNIELGPDSECLHT